ATPPAPAAPPAPVTSMLASSPPSRPGRMQIPIVLSIDVQICSAGQPLPPVPRHPLMHVLVPLQTRPESVAPQSASSRHATQTNGCDAVRQNGRAGGQGVLMSHSSTGVVVGLPGVMPLPDGYVVVGLPLRP